MVQKFTAKKANLHKTITISKPGVYDYEGVMHTWKGEDPCDYFGDPSPALWVKASNVTVKNFGFIGSGYGIRVRGPDGDILENVRIENVEGYSCFKGLDLADSVKGLSLKDVSVTKTNGVPALDEP